jgi:molybdate transport system regulatory protein
MPLDAKPAAAHSHGMVRLTVRIDLGESASIGPGKAKLLEKIAEAGSIRGAAATMGMSYRRAWLLVQELEEIMGAPVVTAATGGAKGGGASLTKLGAGVLKHYRAVERRAKRSAGSDLHALANLARHSVPRR